MDFALKKETIDVVTIKGEIQTEVMVEATINLPRRQSADRIISLSFLPKILEREVVDDAVKISGIMDVDMLYEVEGDEEGEVDIEYYNNKEEVIFNEVIEIPNAIPPATALVDVVIQEVDYELITSDTIEADVVLLFNVKVITDQKVNVVTGIVSQEIDKYTLCREKYNIQKLVGEKTLQSSVNDIIETSKDGPPVNKVLKPLAEAIVISSEISGGKVHVKGLVETGIIYDSRDQNGKQSTHLIHRDPQEIEHMLALPGIHDGMIVKAEVEVADVKSNFINEHEIDLDIVITINAKVYEEKEIDVVTDIVMEDESTIQLQNELLNIERFITKDTMETSGKAVIGVGEDDPPVEKILDIKLRPRVTDSSVMDGKVVVGGDIELEIMYVGFFDEEGEEILHSFRSQMPFEGSKEAEGIEDDMSISTRVVVNDANYNKLDERGIEIMVSLETEVEIMEKVEVNAITDAVSVVPIRKRPGFTVYVVQPEDTLWRISNMYGVNEGVLISENGYDTEEQMQPGDKLIIPRNV